MFGPFKVRNGKFADQPEVSEFAKNHNLDISANGSTIVDLFFEIIKSINYLEYKWRQTDYRLVSMGGHHEIFCNGRDHVVLSGWRYGDCASRSDQTATIEFKKCDCERKFGKFVYRELFKNINESDAITGSQEGNAEQEIVICADCGTKIPIIKKIMCCWSRLTMRGNEYVCNSCHDKKVTKKT